MKLALESEAMVDVLVGEGPPSRIEGVARWIM